MQPRRYFLVLLCAGALHSARLPIQVYTTAQGMPPNSTRCLVPDPNGLLWICTSEGLVRFDGYQFRVFGPEHGLPSRSIFDFVVSRNGGYWLVTEAGVCRLPAGSKIGDPCRPLHVDGPTGEFQSRSFVESRDGGAWVVSTRAIFRVSADGRALERTPVEVRDDEDQLRSMVEAPDGSLIAASYSKVYQWKPGGPPRNITGLFARFVGFYQITVMPPGEVWLLGPTGLYRMTGWQGQSPAIELVEIPRTNLVGGVLRRRDGSLWAAGPGVSRLEWSSAGSLIEVERYSGREGLPGPGNLEFLAEDRQGNLWGP